MELIFLGTSSGIPTRQRNVSGLIIKRRQSRAWCLVDCGEGTQQQLLRVPYSLVKLSCIFITHVHGDHCYGLPGLLATASMAGRTEPLTIVGPKNIELFVKEIMRLTDVRMSYELVFVDVATLDEFSVGKDFMVRPVVLSHRVPSHGYLFEELCHHPKLNTEKLERDGVPKGPLWGDLMRQATVTLEDGRTLNSGAYLLAPRAPRRTLIGGDNDTPMLLHAAGEALEVVVHEATYTQKVADKVGPGPQHSSARQVAEFAEGAHVKNLVLTHFSARYHHPREGEGESIDDIDKEARMIYSGNLFLANDFDHFILSDNDVLVRSDR
ncbi:MAG: MBL fold metallo-hydrolase [Agarilytica sp.]